MCWFFVHTQTMHASTFILQSSKPRKRIVFFFNNLRNQRRPNVKRKPENTRKQKNKSLIKKTKLQDISLDFDKVVFLVV